MYYLAFRDSCVAQPNGGRSRKEIARHGNLGCFLIQNAHVPLCRQESPWAWACRNGRGCVKVAKDLPVEEGDNLDNPTLAGCKLTCNAESTLWPKPRSIISLSKTLVSFHPTDIRINRISAPTTKVINL